MSCRPCSRWMLSGLAVVLSAGLALAKEPVDTSAALPAPEIARSAWPQPPSELFPGLFEAVALADIMPAKDWVDAMPRQPVAVIVAAYRKEAPKSDRELTGFVRAHFTLPGDEAVDEAIPSGLSMREHISSLWPILRRQTSEQGQGSSLIPLPNPYVVPGGRFREVYYWDSYFTMLGLDGANRRIRKEMVDNFAYLVRSFGFIPNANRTYYLSRSQPPFFFMMVGLLSPGHPARAYRDYLDELRTEHAFWMEGAGPLPPGKAHRRVVRLADGALLNRYWDDRDVPRDESYRIDMGTATEAEPRSRPAVYRHIRAAAESGWDFSSRWFGNDRTLASIETVDIIPTDLNSLLYGLERAIAEGCRTAADAECADDYSAAASSRKTAMNVHLWNEELGAFTGFDFADNTHATTISAAMLYPLFFRVATDAQANMTADLVEGKLLAPGGLMTTVNATGQQWDKPN
ncbi:MAG: alpha,alpha-trehalase, partial [Hyphomicrobiales bacterium]|nr:alpha,alpha-trehalase [Hyphomicrobiales bacterium]